MKKKRTRRASRFDDVSAPGSPSHFINRELSLLLFHHRVLAQTKDANLPLLERHRFLTISSSILDEFFEIRVGALKERIALNVMGTSADGMTSSELLARIREQAKLLVAGQCAVLNESLLPALREHGIAILRPESWSPQLREWVARYFQVQILPVLTPVGLDPAHPFPPIVNKSLNFFVTLEGKDAFGRRSVRAVVQAPRVLSRLIRVPAELSGIQYGFLLLSLVIQHHVGELFPGMTVTGCHQFRVTRNSELWVEEEEVEDLLLALKGELPGRQYGDAVRMEVSKDCPDDVVGFLLPVFALGPEDLYRVDGPLNLIRLEVLYSQVDRPDLKFQPFVPGLPNRLDRGDNIFALLREGEIVLHHPFQSFAPVVDFIREAADDPDVLAIKQTVYRFGDNSPMAAALLRAAEAGKEVTAVIELRARFDEASNIDLASRLQTAGAKVVYGIVGYKAHAKMLMIVRREGGTLRRYVHLGTGNYNLRTARDYTDFSLLTSDEQIGADVHAVFQQLTGLGHAEQLRRLVQTPFGLHLRLLELIEAEAAAARDGRPARIILKMNSLIEPQLIQALYRASQSGVRIDLIIRGACCLRPGISGVSDNITVRSVLGRFLEHERIFYFLAGGEEVVYLSSADWMPRNLFRRVEIAFPVESKKHRKRVVKEGLETYLSDNCDAWIMGADGGYTRLNPGSATPVSAQRQLLEELVRVLG